MQCGSRSIRKHRHSRHTIAKFVKDFTSLRRKEMEKMSRKEVLDKYNHSDKGYAARIKYNDSPKGRKAMRKAWKNYSKTEKRQAHESRRSLRRALLQFDVLGKLEGWPDALNVEQKIGLDFVRPCQWRRAASIK